MKKWQALGSAAALLATLLLGGCSGQQAAATPEQAMQNATPLMQAGANMVKLEGGDFLLPTIKSRCVLQACPLPALEQAAAWLAGQLPDYSDEQRSLLLQLAGIGHGTCQLA